MGRNTTSALGFPLAAALLCGCASGGEQGSSPDAGGSLGADAAEQGEGDLESLQLTGMVSGENAPSVGKVLTVWDVKTANPDREYKWGEGTVTENRFSVALESPPPALAINDFGIGVAFAVAVPENKQVAEGSIEDPAALEIQGLSDRHAIIYKAPNYSGGPAWTEAFPTGYSCGRCAAGEGELEVFEMTECSRMNLRAPASLEGIQPCEWQSTGSSL